MCTDFLKHFDSKNHYFICGKLWVLLGSNAAEAHGPVLRYQEAAGFQFCNAEIQTAIDSVIVSY